MPTFIWTEKYRLGVPEVDAQHQRWFVLTNLFLRKLRLGEMNSRSVQGALAEAVGYAQRHFRAEEALMRRIKYAKREYDWHVMQHDAFVERVNALAGHLREGRPRTAIEMAVFMTGWLRKHILEVDLKYVRFYLHAYGQVAETASRPRKLSSRRLPLVILPARTRFPVAPVSRRTSRRSKRLPALRP
jgi:hemerythrin-like metal-binding protein